MKKLSGRWGVLVLLTWLGMAATSSFAQHHAESSDSIHLSSSFLKALDNAFTFTPQADTIRYEENFLTREQLREWVGDVDTTTYIHSADSLYLDPRFLGLTPPQHTVSIMFPDFAKDIQIWKSKNGKYSLINTSGGHQAISGLDVNKALSELLIPKYRKIKKSRKIAEEGRSKIDAAFPIWKE